VNLNIPLRSAMTFTDSHSKPGFGLQYVSQNNDAVPSPEFKSNLLDT